MVPIGDHAHGGCHERVTGVQEGGDVVVAGHFHELRVEGDSVVGVHDRLAVPGDPVPLLDDGRNAANLETVALTHPQGTGHVREGAMEERLHMVRLEPCGFRAFHVAADLVHFALVELGRYELVRRQEFGDAFGDLRVDHLDEVTLPFGLVRFLDRGDHQVPQGVALEQLTEHVVHAPTECGSLFLQLLQQAPVNVTFAGVLGDE